MALGDAAELADCLGRSQFSSLQKALHAFELGMHARMALIVAEAIATQDLLFTDHAPRELVAKFRQEPFGAT